MQKIILLFGLVLTLIFPAVSLSAATTAVPAGFHKYKLHKGDQLEKIIPLKNRRLVMCLNRADWRHLGRLAARKGILIPDDPEHPPFFCPMPQEIGEARACARKIYISLQEQCFGAYAYGRLILWGPISSADGKIDTVDKKVHVTPTGTFYVIKKEPLHISIKESCRGAKMFSAIRLNWDGFFMHAGPITGWPDSHGCVRTLPEDANYNINWLKNHDPVQVVISMQVLLNGYALE